MTFAQLNLDPSISKAILACGYKTPTPIQSRSIPDILEKKDLVACAPTGTGKTAAFVLPALHRLSQPNTARKPRVLVLTPTRELASQITQAAAKYGKFLKFNMASLVGGMSYRQQLRELSRPVDMIVATPGRLLDHMENRRLDLSGIEMLVLDEADRMLDMGFIDDVQAIAKATPHNRQTLLFSATVDNKLGQVVKNLLKNPIRIDLTPEKMAPSQIKQILYLADNPQHRSRLLQHLLDNEKIFKAIIFSATKIGADKLTGQLCDQGYSAAALHGDLKQSMRNRTVEQLRRGKIQFVVATDVASRGIDIADMTHVINYDMPRFCEDYVHRIGRTGRAGKSGIAISFALPSDMRHIQRIEKYIGTRLETAMIDGLEPTQRSRQSSSGDMPSRKKRPFREHNRSRDDRSDKPKKKWGFKEDSRGGRSDKPKKNWGGKDNQENRFEKPKKQWGFKDDSRGGRSDKPKRNWDSKDSQEGRFEKPKKNWGSKEDTRGGRSDKPQRSWDSKNESRFEKPKKQWGFKEDDRGGRFDKPKKSWGAKDNQEGRFEKPKKNRDFKDEARGGRSDKPKKAWGSKENIARGEGLEKPKKKWGFKDDARGGKSDKPKKHWDSKDNNKSRGAKSEFPKKKRVFKDHN